MSNVFISHVEEDADVALAIALGLEQAGFSTWCYELDSVAGVSYLLQTKQAIERSGAVVVVISAHSLGSSQMTKEVVRAHESGKHFVPVLRGIAHAEFQTRQPEWREAVGSATSIAIPGEGVAGILPRVADGLRVLGIRPRKRADPARIAAIRRRLTELGVSVKGGSLLPETPESAGAAGTAIRGGPDRPTVLQNAFEALKLWGRRPVALLGAMLALGVGGITLAIFVQGSLSDRESGSLVLQPAQAPSPTTLNPGTPTPLTTEWTSQDSGLWSRTEVACGDVDMDGTAEIVVSARLTLGAESRAYVFEGTGHLTEWESGEYGLSTIAVGDPDGDGIPEIVLAGDKLRVLDGVTRELEWESDSLLTSIATLMIGDVDGDGSDEIVAGSYDDGTLRDAYVYIFDGVSHALEWTSPDLRGEISLGMGDLDGDGGEEIVCGTRDGYVYVFDGPSSAQEWRSNDLGGYVRGVVADDVDGDGASEIVVGDADGEIYVFDGASKELESNWKSQRTGWISGLQVDDIDNDGVKEIVAGLMVGDPLRLPAYGVGHVHIYDGTTQDLERQSEQLDQFIGGGGLDICDVDNDGQMEIVTGRAGHVYVLGL